VVCSLFSALELRVERHSSPRLDWPVGKRVWSSSKCAGVGGGGVEGRASCAGPSGTRIVFPFSRCKWDISQDRNSKVLPRNH
jgi:hypothetical protein